MTDYGRYKLTFNEAKQRIDSYDNLNDTEFNDQIGHWALYDIPEDYGPIYKDIRSGVVETFKNALEKTGYRLNYTLDLKVGIKLYELLNPSNGFDIVKASDDDIWRYISVCVMPDLTFIRYPNQPSDIDTLKRYIPNLSYAIGIKTEKDSLRLKKKRFYSHTRRIWLKTLWWYVHLGWQGSSEKTFEVLKNNGTNIISHFIERPGRGYREQLFRCMLYAYSLLPKQKDKIFRAAAKLNLAKCISVEPALSEGRETTYSKNLFEEVSVKENLEDDAQEDDFE